MEVLVREINKLGNDILNFLGKIVGNKTHID